MCSLCITSITNINARLSAGGRGRTRISVRSVRICVAIVCVNVFILCVYACSCKGQSEGFYEDSLGQTGGCDTRDTAKEMHFSLGTINTEAFKLGEGSV